MKTHYTVAIAMFSGIVIGGITVQALHAQAKPRAYVVIEIDVMNQEAFFKEFVPAAVKTITDQGGKFLARGGKLVNIEGLGPVYSEVKSSYRSRIREHGKSTGNVCFAVLQRR